MQAQCGAALVTHKAPLQLNSAAQSLIAGQTFIQDEEYNAAAAMYMQTFTHVAVSHHAHTWITKSSSALEAAVTAVWMC